MKKKWKIIIYVIIGLIILFSGFILLNDKNKENRIEKNIREYLAKKNYDDEFDYINFVEKQDYKISVSHWTGGYSVGKKYGTYTRYKVHSVNENFDFFVQYRSETKEFEDNYIITKDQKTIEEKIKNICNKELNYMPRINYSTTIAKEEQGTFEKYIPNIEVIIKEPMDIVCTNEFLNKMKFISDELHNYFKMNNYYQKVYDGNYEENKEIRIEFVLIGEREITIHMNEYYNIDDYKINIYINGIDKNKISICQDIVKKWIEKNSNKNIELKIY